MSNILNQDFHDEEDEDDFNPEPEIGSDEEAETKSASHSRANGRQIASDDEDDDRPQRTGRGARGEDEDDDGEADDDQDVATKAPNDDGEGDEEDEEDEEEEEEEDDEDDDIEGQPSRKRRRRRGNQFIDNEAEVDDDDEEEPEEEDDLPGEEMHPDDMQELPPGADRDDRMHRELDRQRERQETMNAEEEAARLKERYGRINRVAGSGSAVVPQRLLLPSGSDPRIFRIKCRPGKEREIIVAMQNRIFDRMNSRDPIKVMSAFERSGPMAGNIYVEARRQDDVIPAVEGITHVFMSIKPFMVPTEEMPDLLRTRKSKQVEPGMYVRMKRGLYKDDLAQVDEVDPNGTSITLKIVPRLDYGMAEDLNSGAPVMVPDGLGGQKRKRIIKPITQRPPAKLFSENEARKRHGRYLSKISGLSNNAWTYQGREYVDGFLIHQERLQNLLTENVHPKLEEVTKFAAGADDGTENLDLAQLAQTLKASVAEDYLPGDKVEIFRGEQKGVNGQAVEVYGDLVRMRVDGGQLAGQIIEAPIRDLRKLFREGDHVKVIGGSKYQDEVGMVVRMKDDRVTILTDSNQEEITVFSKDLREATDSGGTVGAGKYDLFDLVQLDASTIGCVIKVDRESLRVLDQNGSVRSLLPSNISNRIERRKDHAVATDQNANELKIDDSIREAAGEQRSGQVIHLHRGYVFALNRASRENAGVWVARSSSVITTATKGGRLGTGPDLSKMNPALANGKLGGAAMPPPVQKGRDRLIGKTVKIRSGPHKSMIGIVKDSTELGAIVELHAKNKKITIDKARLSVIDSESGRVLQSDARLGPDRRAPSGPGMVGRTPMGGATPGRAYSAVPATGGRTPAYAAPSGGRTPSWKQDSGRTPAYGGQTAYGGGMTSYGGGTSYGGATSYGGGSVWGGSGQSSYNSGGGKTPAYSGGLEAPTPGAGYDQPTPGYGRSSWHTPANYATPGGLDALTPGPFNAETPAADDGPRYE